MRGEMPTIKRIFLSLPYRTHTYDIHTCSLEEVVCSHRNSNVPYLGSDGNCCGSRLQHLRTTMVTDESVCDRGFTAVVVT